MYLKWVISRSEYFKYVPQKILWQMSINKKSEDWYITHHNNNFDNVIFMDESRFKCYQCT